MNSNSVFKSNVKVFCFSLCLFTLTTGQTLVSRAESVSESNTTKLEQHDYRVYGSLHGFANGSFISEPKSKTLTYNGGLIQLPYPGFGGVGGGAGLSVGMAWRALSLDLGFDWSQDQAEGRIDGETYTMSQSSYHIPLILRAELPSLTVRPSLFVGLDWVSTKNSKLEQPSYVTLSPALLDPQESSYTAYVFGFGFDFMINEQLRLPFRLSAVYAPLSREDLNERVDIELFNNQMSGFRFKSQWEWQPRLSLGLSYDFKTF